MMMDSAASVDAVVQGEDQFRNTDRSIKAYVKTIQQELEQKRSKKRSWAETEPAANAFSWSDVVDPQSSSSRLRLLKTVPGCACREEHDCTNEAMLIYELEGNSSLYVISRAMCDNAQLLWAQRALEVYSTAEHTNLSNLRNQQQQKDEGIAVKGDDNEGETCLWKHSLSAQDGFSSFNKLRWSCLGYHYDWSNRMYQRDLRTPFPCDLSALVRGVAELVDRDLLPEAAIVNYYPLGTCMGGHLDDAEHTLEHPIVSLSMGCSGVFLLGGRTKDIPPAALLLRSGDAVVMAGESRHCYHGVPAILSEEVERRITGQTPRIPSHAAHGVTVPQEVVAYLRSHRINMNVRQVRVGAGAGGAAEGWVDKTGTGYVKYAN